MKLFLKRLLSYLPSKLPQGMAHFDEWAEDIIKTYGMPNNPSIKFALAGQILHLPATAAYKAKAYFGHTLIKGAASQVALGVMEDLKAKQAVQVKAEQEAEAAAAALAASTPVADTTPTEGAATDVKTP